MYAADPSDPQKIAVYQAQTDVVLAHPEDDLLDLPAVRAYLGDLSAAEDAHVGHCYRAWRHDGGDDLIVDRSVMDRDLVGSETTHPADGRCVVVVPWPGRYSHFDPENDEIVVAGWQDGPLSHRLLIVHEISHIKTLTDEGHGPAWVGTLKAMTARRLPQLAHDLNDALLYHSASSTLEA